MYVYSQSGVYYSALYAGSPEVKVKLFLLEIRLNISCNFRANSIDEHPLSNVSDNNKSRLVVLPIFHEG